ncbi:MAG: SUMF1/EgtB/PvdO family nonheme iron enzyme [Microcoleus sp.]
MLGRTLRDRYQIVKLLGKGGFGYTYLATDVDLPGHPHCVVKHLKPNNINVLPIARRLFDTEAQTLYKLGKLHDRIPTLFAHFEENGEFYLVQDFIAGHDLTQEICSGKKLSEASTITLLHDILEILAVVHQQEVIHRDIKPANLMRREDGKIVLIDLGAVKEISTIVADDRGQTNSTIAIGTPGYMSSEQAQGKPRLASDIYAVGAIGIQALTGQSPNSLSEDLQTGEIIWRDRARVSDNLANILDKMVRYNFSQRYQNAGEALQAILSLSPTSISEPSPSQIAATAPPPAPPSPSQIATTPSLKRLSPSESLHSLPTIAQTPTTPAPTKQSPSGKTRRIFLFKLAGFAGVGLVAAFAGKNLSNKFHKTRSNPVSIYLKTVEFDTVTVNSTGKIINRIPGRSQFFAEAIATGIILDMVAIPGGSFLMGSPNTEAEREQDEGPLRTVNVAPFFMGKYQVTQAQWRAVSGLPKVKIDLNPNPSKFQGDNLPVDRVNWYEAVEFCARLSQLTRRNYRLPSEAEWEYACRAGTKTPFYFGETVTPDLANYDGNYVYASGLKGIYRKKTIAVGSFPANNFGLYDMHGNVWEWCQDIWHDNYQGAPMDGTAWETGGDDNRRLLRGGSWFDNTAHCRSAVRFGNAAGYSLNYGGFRVAAFV